MTGDRIRAALSCGRQSCECATGPNTHCPGPSHARGDRNPSLTVHERDGKVLVNCKGGCSQGDVIADLQSRDLWPRGDDGARVSASPSRLLPPEAEYEYRDEAGRPAFRVVRFPPASPGGKKTFRQKRPNGRGGWEWKKGDTRILYRLPELLASDPSEIVWLCEGEKDADRLASCGLVATTRAEGAGKWRDDNNGPLRGRRVVILEDNDAAGELDARVKLASVGTVASEAAILKLEPLPAGGDVSDWLDLGGTLDHLIGLGEMVLGEAGSEATPQPALAVVEATQELRPMPMVAFPTEVMPASLAALIDAAAEAMLVPPEFVGVPLLVLAGAAIGNAWELELKAGWREGPNLYAAIVADPGSKKTPALKLATRPIYAIQRELHNRYTEEKKRHDAELAAWEASNKKDRGAKPEAPAYPHVVTTDATTEALAGMLASGKGLALHRDELVAWVLSMDQYRSGKGSDRQHYLSMWSRAPIKIDRKSRPDPIIVDRPCLAVVGGIQPDVLPDLVGGEGRDDGFLDRLLWCYPDLDEDRWTDASVDARLEDAAGRLFIDLYRLDGQEMPSGDVLPRVARLDAGALALWREWYDVHAAEGRSDDLAPSLRGTWAKLPSQLARLTLILHVARAVDAGEQVGAWVPERTIADAADLVEFFKDHARSALAAVKTTRSKLDARILRALESGPLRTRDIFAALGGGRVKADRLKSALENLVEGGRIVAIPVAAGAKGGRPGVLYALPEAQEQEYEARPARGRKNA